MLKFASFLAAAALIAPDPAQGPSTSHSIDLSEYTRSFAEDFNTLSVSASGDGKSRWIAHTPWSGDFGDAEFTDPEPGFPFSIDKGVLRIEARKGTDGKWRSGLLSALDERGEGFCQQYGYFEARMKLPPGKGVWPAFWLIGRDKSKGSAEVDVIEYYGQFDNTYRSTWHVWKSELGQPDEGESHVVSVPPGSLTARFHSYGVDISPEAVRFYLDRQEVWRAPTPTAYQTCFYPLVNLALGSGWPIDETPNPSFLWVDYIHVYRRKSN